MKRNCLILLFLVASLSANATIRYVSMLGNDNNNGTAWHVAKRSIDGALSDAVQGDTVFVAIGTYEKFSARNGVHVFGGFLGTEQSLAQRQAMHHGYLQDSSCTRIFTAYQCEHFMTSYYSSIDHSEAATVPTVLDGMVVKVDSLDFNKQLILALLDGDYHLSNCTLDGGYMEVTSTWRYPNKASYGFSNMPSGYGFHVSDCAIRHCNEGCLLAEGSRTVRCLFEYNATPVSTRPISNRSEYGLVQLEDCVIQNNSLTISYFPSHRATLNLESNVDLRRCVIRNNSVVVGVDGNWQSSAEIICANRRCRITNCLFANNSVNAAHTYANLVYLRYGANLLQNNTFVSNTVADTVPNGPSCLLRRDVSADLYNNLFWGNTGHSQFINVFNLSTDDVMFNAMQDTLVGQTGNFRLDLDSVGPRFVNPTPFVGPRFDDDSIQLVLAADWHLSSGSSCVNAGHPYHVSLPYQTPSDLDGLNRLSGGRIDIGCYEFPQADAEQNIVWEQPLRVYRSEGQLPLTATASSGLPVSYSSSNPDIATVSGDTLLLLAAGRCTVTATQSGDSIWLPAPSISRTLTVCGDTVMMTIWATDTIVVYDTVTGLLFDTIPIYDTTMVFDTIPIYDTAMVFDTVTVYDTVQVSIGDVDIPSLPWTINVEGEYISVHGADGETIRVFDALGRLLHTQPAASAAVRFRMPASGVYLIKVGGSPARKVTIIR